MKILLVNGPNLNMLGKREPEIYGTETLADIESSFQAFCRARGWVPLCFQSNSEGEMVDFIQKEGASSNFLLINAGAYTHTSVAIRDAIKSVDLKIIEVHLSNVYKREPFRHKSYLSDIAEAVLAGFGSFGYTMALQYIDKKGDNNE